MKGYWHIVALSTVMAAISIILDKNFFLLVFAWLGLLYMNQRLRAFPFLLSICSFLFFIYYLPAIDLDAHPKTNLPSRNDTEGKIIKAPVFQSNKIEVVLEKHGTSEKVMILYFPEEGEMFWDEAFQLRLGADCVVHGKTVIPEEARNPGEFNYRKFLLNKNIAEQIIIRDLSEIECEGASFWQRFIFLRTYLIRQTSNKLSDETAAWLNALVLGDDSMLEDRIITLFQDWGLSHILAISGLHIGIVVGLVYFLLIKTNLLTKEKSELVMFLFLPVFAILAGGEPSVLRASSMVLLFLILRRMNILASALDVISIVFLFLLLFEPFLIYHIGFQFSFSVTLGIILSRKWLKATSSPSHQLLIISFISQMAILPLQLNYFSLFQPLSILVNVIVVPYFSLFVIPFMFIILLLSFLPSSFLHALDVLFIFIHERVLILLRSENREMLATHINYVPCLHSLNWNLFFI